jgi:hypothetical protein
MVIHIDPDPRRSLVPGLEEAIDEILEVIDPVPSLACEKSAFRRED